MKSFLRVFKMLRPDSAATGILILSFFDSYGTAAYEKEIPREGILCLPTFRCKSPDGRTILYRHHGFQLPL